MWYYFKDDDPLRLKGFGMKSARRILLIFAVFCIFYGVKYGRLLPLWCYPVVLLVVGVWMVIGASGRRR
jgi:Flp pilus assembly protein TadB